MGEPQEIRMAFSASPKHPHSHTETPDDFEPDALPVEPDEGLVPPAIPVDPEHDRMVDPER
ncbi:MAG: hypothetical protein V4738_08580 [Pseudomonadota bacterium]